LCEYCRVNIRVLLLSWLLTSGGALKLAVLSNTPVMVDAVRAVILHSVKNVFISVTKIFK